MGTFYLGPLEARDLDTIKHALETRLESIEDCIENGPMLTMDEARNLAAEQTKVGRLIDVCESLVLSN
jgi:hypothetical protein